MVEYLLSIQETLGSQTSLKYVKVKTCSDLIMGQSMCKVHVMDGQRKSELSMYLSFSYKNLLSKFGVLYKGA